jgi:hypothetical protein
MQKNESGKPGFFYVGKIFDNNQGIPELLAATFIE